MESAKEIKSRIKSVRDTQKITNAMYLISSNKLRRAKRELDATRPFFDMLRGEIVKIFDNVPEATGRYIASQKKAETADPKSKVHGYLVVTADKGLAGAYNQNVLKRSLQMMEQEGEYKLYVVGEFGRQFYLQKNIEIERSFLYTAQNPNMFRAREIAEILLEPFDRGELDDITVIYTYMQNNILAQAKVNRLLPFSKEHFTETPKGGEAKQEYEFNQYEFNQYEFYPSVEAVLDSVVRSYLSGYIYSVLVESFCSEQMARMTAMDAASRNADEMLQALSLRYNTVRQAAITQEITEVAAGAKAQKRKKSMSKGAMV